MPKKNPQTDCSVIILSFNTKDITDECLKRVTKAAQMAEKKGLKIEVIVIDNGSKDGSMEMLAHKYSQWKIISRSDNLGYARGNNLGMAEASGRYFLLLNSDAYLNEDTLINAIRYMDETNHDAMGCRLTFADGRFQPSAGFLPEPGNVISWLTGLELLPMVRDRLKQVHPKNEKFFAVERQVGWVMGAFLMIRRQVYELTGGFDPNFFLYMEEVEWCLRMQKAGLKIYYTPSFSIVHLDKASSGFNLAKPLRREMQGLVYLFGKHYPQWQGVVKVVVMVTSALRAVAFSVSGKKDKALGYWQVLTNEK